MPEPRITNPEAHPQRLRVAHLNPNAANPFLLRPSADTRAQIADQLDLQALPRLEFAGEIRAESGDGWRLDARLRARATQSCVVTTRPVRSDIEDEVTLRFTPHLGTPEGEEVEMPDETLEPLGTFIDLTAAMIEALSLALPPYPRAEGARLPDAAAPTDSPESEDQGDSRRPFAGLEKLLKVPPRDQG